MKERKKKREKMAFLPLFWPKPVAQKEAQSHAAQPTPPAQAQPNSAQPRPAEPNARPAPDPLQKPADIAPRGGSPLDRMEADAS